MIGQHKRVFFFRRKWNPEPSEREARVPTASFGTNCYSMSDDRVNESVTCWRFCVI